MSPPAARTTATSDNRAELLRWRVHTEVILLAVAAVTMVLAALPAAGGHVSAVERWVFRVVNDLPAWPYRPVWVVMQFGNGLTIVVVAGFAVSRRRFRLGTALAASGISVWLLAKGLKQVVVRGRPPALLAGVHVRGALATGHGFPSGHAAVAFALATVAWLWFGHWTRWSFVTAAVVVAFARVYVGAHFPLDVVGGAALGTLSGALVGLLLSVRAGGPTGSPTPRR